MAYINKDQVAQKRAELKKAFPDCKFSVRKNAHSSTLQISLLRSKIEVRTNLSEGVQSLNSYWLKESEHLNDYGKKLFQEVKRVANRGNHDNSDPMTDYFDVGWYLDLSIGDYGRPYEAIDAVGYDIFFNDDTTTDNKGWENSSASDCFDYIKAYNGTDDSYFADYKGGVVQVIHSDSGEILMEEKIKL